MSISLCCTSIKRAGNIVNLGIRWRACNSKKSFFPPDEISKLRVTYFSSSSIKSDQYNEGDNNNGSNNSINPLIRVYPPPGKYVEEDQYESKYERKLARKKSLARTPRLEISSYDKSSEEYILADISENSDGNGYDNSNEKIVKATLGNRQKSRLEKDLIRDKIEKEGRENLKQLQQNAESDVLSGKTYHEALRAEMARIWRLSGQSGPAPIPIALLSKGKAQELARRRKYPTGWDPSKKLPHSAMDEIRQLHSHDSKMYSISVLAQSFTVSEEAIRRILRSKFVPKVEKMRMKVQYASSSSKR